MMCLNKISYYSTLNILIIDCLTTICISSHAVLLWSEAWVGWSQSHTESWSVCLCQLSILNSFFFPHQTVYELDSVKFSFIAKSAKANIHLTHCQCSAFICKWRDNACTLRTFTVIFGNITKLVGSIFTYWHLCILCGFVHLRKIKSIFTLFNLK